MDKKILDNFKEDEIKIPDSLLPENIGAILDKEDKRKKSTYIFQRVALAAAAVAVVGGVSLGVAMQQGIVGNNNTLVTTEGEKTNSGLTIEALDNFFTHNDYSKIYKVFGDYVKANRYQYGIGSIFWQSKDQVVYDTNTAVAETGAAPQINLMETQQATVQATTGSQAEGSSATDDYYTVNSQEAGVQEGDVVATDGKYIYILRGQRYTYDNNYTFLIFETDNGSVKKKSEIKVEFENKYNLNLQSLYILGDTIALVGDAYTNYEAENNARNLAVSIYYNVEDKENPALINTQTQSGYYVSSRVSDGYLYMISDLNLSYRTNFEKKNHNSYIPALDGACVEANDIYCPPEFAGYRGYTVITSTQMSDPVEFTDAETVMMNSENLYMSGNAIYFSSSDYIEYTEDCAYSYPSADEATKDAKVYVDESEISKFVYKNGQIEYMATGSVPGEIDGQYSFSEYNGYLRVATTSLFRERPLKEGYYTDVNRSSGVYILDENMQYVSEVSGLAADESIKSVRFLGDMAYVVTFRNTDPLFVIDLSDVNCPKVLGELKTSGFSEYLHPYGGKLFGLGYDADERNGRIENVKLSMFDINDPLNPMEIAKESITDCTYCYAMYDPTELLVSDTKNIIGFTNERYVEKRTDNNISYENILMYSVYTYDKEQGFVNVINCEIPFDDYGYQGMRGLYIGGYLYIMNVYTCDFFVYSLEDYSYISTWNYNR